MQACNKYRKVRHLSTTRCSDGCRYFALGRSQRNTHRVGHRSKFTTLHLPGCRNLTAASLHQRTAIVARASEEDLQAAIDKLQRQVIGIPLYLVGMMGSGKSTVGKVLSQALSYRFFDTDDIIEKSLNAPVTQIFEENGEQTFRDIESQVLQELSQYTRSVISTGGGVVMRRENWGNMRHGVVIWLNGTPETLSQRISGEQKNSRPLLNETEDEASSLAEELKSILDERSKFYNEADGIVNLEDAEDGQVLSPIEVAIKVIETIQESVERKAQELEEKKNFEIEEVPSTMEVREPRGFGTKE